MAHLQYMPGDPRLVDQLVYELKSKGIFDQFRKECIADVDTRPAYQNLRQRVESSVSTFLSRQCWKPDLNKNQLREKLRKHILDGNYLEQGVERIVDQVVNPKVASVFIPQVEDLVYNYLGITRKKAPVETAEKIEDLLPTDLEAVSPGSVKSNDDKDDKMEIQDELEPMEVDQDVKEEIKEEVEQKPDVTEIKEGVVTEKNVPVLAEEFILDNIPEPTDSPPKTEQDKPVSKEVSLCDIPLPEDVETETTFKPIQNSEDSNSSSGSSLRRNMSPLTPVRNYTNENSCDAQQGFDNDSDCKEDKEPSSFSFSIESNDVKEKKDKKDTEPDLSYQFNQVNINAFNTPMYDDSSNSNLLRIDYESDTNSKNVEKPEMDTEDSKKERRDDRKSHKSSHRSRDSHRHSSSTDKRSDSKHSSSRDSSRHDKKSSTTKDDHKRSSKDNRDRSKDRDRKDSRDSSKHRSSSSSQKSSRDHRDSKSHRSSSSNHKSSSSKTSEKKSSSSSSSKEKDKSESRDKSSRDKDRKDSKSRSDKDHRSDKDRKSKKDEKDKKKDKKDIDDHYSSSGRGNNGRRSTDRDSNDGSSSSKGSQNQNGSKTAESKKESKNSSSKSDNTSPSGESTSPSDKEVKLQDTSKQTQFKPVRVENLETPIAKPPRLPFVPDVTLKKPKYAANFEEAKKMMKMRKFLDEEQKRMNQEAALLLEFQANVRPSLSQVYSSIPGPELEFVCGSNTLITNTACEIDIQAKTDTDFDSDTQKNDNFAVPRVVIERCAKIDNVSKDVEEKTIDVKESECKVEESIEEIQKSIIESSPSHIESSSQNEMKAEVSYDENKPFSTLMDEISEYSKASEIKYKENEVKNNENIDKNVDNAEIDDSNEELTDLSNEIIEDKNLVNKTQENNIESQIEGKVNKNNTELNTDSTVTTETRNFEITIIAEEIDDTDEIKPNYELKYFSNEEQETAETEKDEFNTFLKQYIGSFTNNRIYLINCDTYEENIITEVAASFGDYEIVNYYKNGNLKLPNTSKNIVKDIPLTEELSLPMESIDYDRSPIFSPAKSECSFELSSDYDARLNEIVNKKSRQEVLEIILGSVLEDTSEASVDLDYTGSLKRKMDDDVMVDINRSVLTPSKVRKLSDSDQISSTTEDQEDEVSNNNKPNTTRSKYLGKARRVGLPKPKRCNLVNSPSSDKSVENYVQNARPSSPQPPNGKLKSTPRSKVQRYDTSDLYKPKLHYLSRRNNIS